MVGPPKVILRRSRARRGIRRKTSILQEDPLFHGITGALTDHCIARVPRTPPPYSSGLPLDLAGPVPVTCSPRRYCHDGSGKTRLVAVGGGGRKETLARRSARYKTAGRTADHSLDRAE